VGERKNALQGRIKTWLPNRKGKEYSLDREGGKRRSTKNNPNGVLQPDFKKTFAVRLQGGGVKKEREPAGSLLTAGKEKKKSPRSSSGGRGGGQGGIGKRFSRLAWQAKKSHGMGTHKKAEKPSLKRTNAPRFAKNKKRLKEGGKLSQPPT